MSQVLVIDDDPLMRSLMRRLVESMGHSVLWAENGLDGLDLFERFRPELVVTDIYMPEGGADELIPRLRRLEPRVKIIVVSGGATTGDPAKATNLSADMVLGKPFRVADFLAAVGTILRGAPAG
jgi:DNA-binding response OmpR family regulator